MTVSRKSGWEVIMPEPKTDGPNTTAPKTDGPNTTTGMAPFVLPPYSPESSLKGRVTTNPQNLKRFFIFSILVSAIAIGILFDTNVLSHIHQLHNLWSVYLVLPMLGMTTTYGLYKSRNSAWERNGINNWEWLLLAGLLSAVLGLSCGKYIGSAISFDMGINTLILLALGTIGFACYQGIDYFKISKRSNSSPSAPKLDESVAPGSYPTLEEPSLNIKDMFKEILNLLRRPTQPATPTKVKDCTTTPQPAATPTKKNDDPDFFEHNF